MAPLTPRLVVPIDVENHPREQKVPLHNRWHPDIPPVADVTEGEFFRIEMVDWSGGRVRMCNEHGTIYTISSDFGDRMTMQSMGLMLLLSEHL